MSTETCPFCQIVRGEAAAAIMHRDETVVAFRDARPVASTHVLIIPTVHIASLNELGASQASLLGHMMIVARDIADHEGVGSSGYRLVVNTGLEAGQSVFHFHLHLIGGRQMHWPPG